MARANSGCVRTAMEQAWTYSVQDALRHYGVSPEKGLTSEQVAKAQKQYGPNGTWVAHASGANGQS